MTLTGISTVVLPAGITIVPGGSARFPGPFAGKTNVTATSRQVGRFRRNTRFVVPAVSNTGSA